MTEHGFQDVVWAVRLLGDLFGCDPKTSQGAPALLEALASANVEELAAQWPYVDADSALPLLREMQQGAAGDAGELARSYRHLFVGPNALAAPPYGSVYTDRDRVVFGESTLALRDWLRRVGIGVSDLDGAPEDHIGTMLALLAWMGERKPHLVDEYLVQHLLTWAPHYLEELEEASTESPFYLALAKLARMTLEGMQEERGLEVVLPRFYQ